MCKMQGKLKSRFGYFDDKMYYLKEIEKSQKFRLKKDVGNFFKN